MHTPKPGIFPSWGSRTFARFCVTGLSGVAVNLGSFQLLLGLGLHRFLASPIAIEIRWTFREAE